MRESMLTVFSMFFNKIMNLKTKTMKQFMIPSFDESISLPKRQAASYVVTTVFFLIFICFFASCSKDNGDTPHFDYNLLYNKKCHTISQAVTPIWTYPATGKSYDDVWNFAKEVFPCVTDDYEVFDQNGAAHNFHNTNRCDTAEPDESPLGYFYFDNRTDSLWIDGPLEVPGQPPVILNVRCKVLELTNDKLIVRYNQILPFTNTHHIVTETYVPLP
jgi:hypothetical protein